MTVTVKDSVRNLAPYQNGSHTETILDNHKKILKLDSNEATIPPSPKVLMALSRHIYEGPLNWYPDVESSKLRRKLSSYTSLPEECILTFNGSDHALKTITRAYLSKGDEVILFQPTYDHFRLNVEAADATVVGVRENQDLALKDKVLQGASPKTKIVYLVNPNNPTGRLTPIEEIREALALFPHILFIVDEAYYEFSKITAAPLVREFPNVIVSRSFSKAFGLAALRCGYLLATPEICAQVGKIRIGKNINALAQVAGCVALDDLEYMEHFVEEVNQMKSWLIDNFQSMGLETKTTPANYILVKVAEPEKVMEFLSGQNIYIRDRSKLQDLEGYLRLTVGDQFSMKRFWRVFTQVPKAYLVNGASKAAETHIS